MIRLPHLVCTLALLAAAAWVWPLQAQVRRCVAADGQLVYTDRQCADIGAVERIAPPPSTPGATLGGAGRARWSCARNVEDLVYQLNNALLVGDVNQVAGVYHWTGMSTQTAYAIMDRLQALTKRQTLDVAALYSTPRDPYADGGVIEVPLGQTDWPALPPPPRPRLIGIRVMQTASARSSAAINTTFGLVRNVGCWWIRY